MSSLTETEKLYFEKLFGMSSGYVLDFTDSKFGTFFRRFNVEIHSIKYQTLGMSKAKKLRSFWESEPDELVGALLFEMLDYYEVFCELTEQAVDEPLLEKARGIARRLIGQPVASSANNEIQFLEHEFLVPNIHKLPIDGLVVPIVEGRLNEVHVALRAGAHLSVILLCGSVLEAVLLGAAQQAPASFNQARSTPKNRDGSPRRFPDWSLAQLIDVAYEVGDLQLDVKKFSHGLRDFRNYIHPYQQLSSGFTPDEHTAKVCFQVLKAALASLTGER